MKRKIVLIVLVLTIVGLSALLAALERRSDAEQRMAGDQLKVLSNSVVSTTSSLDEIHAVNLALESNLVTHKAEFSNSLAASQAKCDAAAAELARVEADAQTQAAATVAELARLDKQILELEAHHQDLDAQSNDLHNAITNLEDRIQDTKNKLAKSTGDRTFLINELRQLQARKNALEKDFNNLAVVLKQLHKLKAAITAARIHDWVRRGVYASFNQKGAQRLLHPVVVLPPDTNTVWHVELNQDGGVAITAPYQTNKPAPH
jgi:chromosome segregation ATPase